MRHVSSFFLVIRMFNNSLKFGNWGLNPEPRKTCKPVAPARDLSPIVSDSRPIGDCGHRESEGT